MTKSSTLRTCRICGCSENAACSYMTAWGRANCYWLSQNLCSHPRCRGVAASRLAFEVGSAINGLGCVILAVAITAREPAFAVAWGVVAAMLLFWAETLRDNRLHGKRGDNPLGHPRDWAFWCAIAGIVILGGAGIQVSANRLPAALARARAMQVQTARPVGGAR